MSLLVVFILVYACKNAIDDARQGWRKSRAAYMASADERFPDMPKGQRAAHAARHDAGYWTGQLVRAFPVLRHSLAAGWHKGRQAQAEGQIARERARAEHLETRARLVPEITAWRERQRKALERIRAAVSPAPDTDTGQAPPDAGGVTPPASAGETVLPPATGGYTGRSPSWQGPLPPSADGVTSPDSAAGTGPAAAPQPRICVACGNPENGPRKGGGNWGPVVLYDEPLFDGDNQRPRWIHKAHFENESTGYYGRPYRAAPDAGDHAPDEQSPTEGGTMPTGKAGDVTYDAVIKSMTQATTAAESAGAWQKQACTAANSMSEQMQALEVDPVTLSAMADYLDAQDAAEKAQQKVIETAMAVTAALKRGHQGLAEAHQNAPVEAAAKQFYDQ